MVSGGLLVPVEYYQGLLTFCLSIVIADPLFWPPLFLLYHHQNTVYF